MMGRRSLRSGDLVCPNRCSSLMLRRVAQMNTDVGDITNDIVVHHFKMGMLICLHRAEIMWCKHITKALVLDSSTGVYGWCDLGELMRVK